MVRNYLLGYLLTGLDGPFSIAEIVKTFIVEEVETGFYDSFVNTIKTITPEEIQALANKYLRKENMYEIVVG